MLEARTVACNCNVLYHEDKAFKLALHWVSSFFSCQELELLPSGLATPPHQLDCRLHDAAFTQLLFQTFLKADYINFNYSSGLMHGACISVVGASLINAPLVQ